MTDIVHTKSKPAYTRHHWGKADRQDHGRIHLLEHHLADVGACFEELLRQTTIRQRLERSAGLEDLDEVSVSRLATFAALHDIGKASVGFQARIWNPEDAPEGERLPKQAGHTLDLTPILTGRDSQSSWLFDALGWDRMLSWDDKTGETVCDLFIAALSHHGLPLHLQNAQHANPAMWRDFGELSPRKCIERIAWLVREKWFPAAFNSVGPPLPSSPAFQHMFLGLCTLADWIGSNEQWFPFVSVPDDDYIEKAQVAAKRAVAEVGLNLLKQREAFSGVPHFGDLFDIDSQPTPIQRAAVEVSLDHQLVIIESETGSGKTEAALWRFSRMYQAGLVDGLYFALPTRSAASQMHERVSRIALSMFLDSDTRPAVTLAVPGYIPVNQSCEGELQGYPVWWDDNYRNETQWVAENPKRYLAAQIAVGTIDQAMMGALKIKHSHLRAASLARNLLVVDEVHASNRYMSEILTALLQAHMDVGGYALLMSATLGSVARTRWLHGRGALIPNMEESISDPYPAISTSGNADMVATDENGQPKRVRIKSYPQMYDFGVVARRAIDAARQGAKVLVVRNTVDYAVRTQMELERSVAAGEERLLFSVGDIPTLHHGRFAVGDRRALDGRIEQVLGSKRSKDGLVVVGTQTLEQSLDIDADLLITDLCPADVLLQRIGRLHRHRANDTDRTAAYSEPTCITLTPPGDDLSPMLKSGRDANGLGPKGYVYEDLRILEATRRLTQKHGEWLIPDMNRELVEQATHSEALESIATQMGEDWKEHSLEVEGVAIGDGMTARGSIVRRDRRFFVENGDILFPSDDERIRTRLGDDRIDVRLNPPQSSPLGVEQLIDKLAISVRWLPEGQTPESVDVEPVTGGFHFSIGEREFIYDRLGLRRI